jgi:WD40 repeat protein
MKKQKRGVAVSAVHQKMMRFDSGVRSMARRGDVLAFGLHSGEIAVGDRVRGWKGHDIAVTSLDFTLDGRLLSGSADGAVKLWDAETGENLWARDLGVGKILSVAALADGRLAAAGNDGSVRVLDATGRTSMTCRGHEEYVTSIVSLQSDDDAFLFCSGSYDGRPSGCALAMGL